MHILFVHRAFPAQFGRLALELTKRYGWKCSLLIEHLSRCPTPSAEMLEKLELLKIPYKSSKPAGQVVPWPQSYGDVMAIAQGVFEAVRTRSELRPDLVVAHGALAPIFLLRELLDCPLIDYCEYYLSSLHRDLTYRIDLPPAEPAPFSPRCINAATLVNFLACEAGYSPTRWQRDSFPERFRPKIEVHPDGIDTDLYRPRRASRLIGSSLLPADKRIVTYVARGLESMRGFDLFMQVARRICQKRANVLFVIAGDEETYYGWDKLITGGLSFKEWVLRQSDFDLSRFVFLGHIEPQQLADVLCLSDLHIHLTVPFVLSWSLYNALACGCVVLASDVPPVREVIEPGHNGLLEPLFDLESLTKAALGVLDDPGFYQPLGRAARVSMEERYSLDVAIPELKDFFERIASKQRMPELLSSG